jgi:hypothetical protein
MEMKTMNNGIDLNDLPGAQGRRDARNANLVKPGMGEANRIAYEAPIWYHQPAIRVIPNVPAAWIRPNRNRLLDSILSFFGTIGTLLGTLLKGLILLLLVGGLVYGTGVFLFNVGEQLIAWIGQAGGAVLSGLQYLAQGAIDLFFGLIDLIVGGLLFALVAVVETAVWCVESIVNGIINACVWLIQAIIDSITSFVVMLVTFVVDFWVGLFLFVIDLIVLIVELIFVVLLGILIGAILGLVVGVIGAVFGALIWTVGLALLPFVLVLEIVQYLF